MQVACDITAYICTSINQPSLYYSHKGDQYREVSLDMYMNISLSVAPPLMERSYRSIPSGILTAHTE